MKFLTLRKIAPAGVALVLSACIAGSNAQDAASVNVGAASGGVSGRVTYSDSKAPARLAQVMLLKVAPAGSKTGDAGGNALQSFMSGCSLKCISTTGLDGSFQMTEIPVGQYIVLASQSGAVNPLAHIDLEVLNKTSAKQIGEDQIKDSLNYLTFVTVEAGKTASVVVNLTHGASISGALSYDDGSPAVGVKVKLLTKTKSGSFEEPNMMTLGGVSNNVSLAGNMTDDEGRFHIAGLMPGVYAVRATLPINALKNLSKNIKGAMALGMSSPNQLGTAMTMDDGLSVYSGNVFFKKDLKPIELGENQQMSGADLQIPVDGMHSVEVHVTDSASGSPMQVAQVELLDADGKEILRSGYVDDGGECSFEYVPDGMYTLRVVNAMDVSQVGKMLSDNYDPKKAIHYGTAEIKVRVSEDVNGIVLQVSKAADEVKAAQ